MKATNHTECNGAWLNNVNRRLENITSCIANEKERSRTLSYLKNSLLKRSNVSTDLFVHQRAAKHLANQCEALIVLLSRPFRIYIG